MKLLVVASACLLSACGGGEPYTLYRNSVMDANMRVHVANFDTADGDAYNNENCNLAAKLFQSQESVKTRFWCEKGSYRK